MKSQLARIAAHAGILAAVLLAQPARAQSSTPPDTSSDTSSGPAERALFDTPHLHNVARPETLQYRFERTGPQPLTDNVNVTVDEIHPDGTKLVSFAFLSGDNFMFYPSVDHFKGNPVLMAFLEHDVGELKSQTGIAAAHFRNEIRQSFTTTTDVTATTAELDGKSVDAQQIVLKPFADDDRLGKLPSYQEAEYRFVLADAVPGGIQSIDVSMPADPKIGAPAWSEKITFAGVKP